MIPDLYLRILAVFWGLVLGAAYFGGLWLTVRKMPVSQRPKSLWIFSFIVRMGVLLMGLWLMLRLDMVAFCAAFAAVMTARIVIRRFVLRSTFGVSRHRTRTLKP